MLRTIEVFIALSLVFLLVLFAVRLTQAEILPRELTSLKASAEQVVLSKLRQESFRRAVLDSDLPAVRADLNSAITTPLEVQICSGLGNLPTDCSGNLPDVNHFATLNYLVSSDATHVRPFVPKTLRVFVWLVR